MGINNYLVSIIMPSFNAELYIREAIDSVLNQTYKNWELIIVDDGSTDCTAKVAKNRLVRDKRIHYYFQENGKQGKARNFGISKSKGVFLAFLDADDLWLPEKLEIQLQEIIEKNVDLLFSDCYVFDNYEIDNDSQKMNIPTTVFYDKSSLHLFLERNRIPILTVLVKKEKVLDVGGFSEVLAIQNIEDYHLWLKLLMTDCIFYTSDYVSAKYRVHNSSATSSDKLALNKIPDAFYDLLQLHPSFRKLIENELKVRFNSIYNRNLFTKADLDILIRKNTQYLSNAQMRHFYYFLNFLLPTNITKRTLIYILNA